MKSIEDLYRERLELRTAEYIHYLGARGDELLADRTRLRSEVASLKVAFFFGGAGFFVMGTLFSLFLRWALT